MKAREKFTGGCACGEVRFGFNGPQVSQVACHCRACQYSSGGGPAYAVVALKEEFRVTNGFPKEFTTLTEDGHMVTRAFCGTCGTHLFAFSDRTPEYCSVKVGALDEAAKFRPRAHLWTSEAPRWHKRHRFTLRFSRNAPVRGAARGDAAGAPETD